MAVPEPGNGPRSWRLQLRRLPRSTPLGRRAGLIGMGLLFAGFNTGNNLFYLLFTVMAASELIGFVLAGRSLGALEAQIVLPRRARAGAPVRVAIRLTNAGRRLSVPALRWTVRTSTGDTAEIRTPVLRAGEQGSGTGLLVVSRRGRMTVALAEAHSDYPLGLARRIGKLDPGARETLVTPRIAPARMAHAGPRRGDVRTLAHPRGLGEEALDAREYRPGDDARRIDWKATARSERLMWRDRRGDPPRAIQVRLDRSGPPGEGFERRVSRTAGAVARALERGHPVGFVTDELTLLPRSGPVQRRRIMDYLALVEPAGAATSPSLSGARTADGTIP